MGKKVLLIKMSSLGDLVQTFPALTDAQKVFPDIQFDWVVEEPFKDLPKLHPAVNKVIVSPRLAIRKNRLSLNSFRLYRDFKRELQSIEYDLVIENHYVTKAAKVAALARGVKHGLDAKSARDPSVARKFDHTHYVALSMHAIDRSRKLFAMSLGYEYQPEKYPSHLDYGLDLSSISLSDTAKEWKSKKGDYLVFCQATTWATKHLPENMWVELLLKAKQESLPVLMPWIGDKEHTAVSAMIQKAGWGEMLPEQTIDQWAKLLESAKGVIGVDTGLTHLACALNRPTLSLFGPSNPLANGAKGQKTKTLWLDLSCSPCMKRNSCFRPEGQVCFSRMDISEIWKELQELFEK